MSDVVFEHDIERVFDVGGVSACLDKIVARAAGQDAERDVVEIVHAVENLVERAVSAHHQDDGVGGFAKLARDFSCVSRIFGLVNDIRNILAFQRFFDGGESLQAFALSALRVDNDVIHKTHSDC